MTGPNLVPFVVLDLISRTRKREEPVSKTSSVMRRHIGLKLIDAAEVAVALSTPNCQ